ncbi:hypothetical protein Taro_046059 [Colocasia esculenta]|uniref:dolichyl-diphosphooligosaccharide--protein glycotransferase n=1 Tax=Colocasia esculenta TaxID=4460 RepID=A0A843X1H5_COLES|nr:hypothetical protein [Colocasia esculenta]
MAVAEEAKGVPSTLRNAFGNVLCFFALLLIVILAFSIRLFSVIKYESLVHEFDPYFNYRVTQYLTKSEIYDFWNWFDDRAWYPLGRVIGGTVYPGLTLTAGSLWWFVETDGKGFDRVRRTEIGKKHFKLTHFEEYFFNDILVVATGHAALQAEEAMAMMQLSCDSHDSLKDDYVNKEQKHASFGTTYYYQTSLEKEEYANFIEAQRQLHIQRMLPDMGPSYTISWGAFKNVFEEQEIQAWPIITHHASLLSPAFYMSNPHP